MAKLSDELDENLRVRKQSKLMSVEGLGIWVLHWVGPRVERGWWGKEVTVFL